MVFRCVIVKGKCDSRGIDKHFQKHLYVKTALSRKTVNETLTMIPTPKQYTECFNTIKPLKKRHSMQRKTSRGAAAVLV